jgi:hypothetical protein
MMKNKNLNKKYFYLKEMSQQNANKSRFCYSYTPPGPIDNCCKPNICATNDHISLISSIPMVINNSTRTSERSLLLSLQQQFIQENVASQVSSVVSTTISNSSAIAETLFGQLQQIQRERYAPYQPYMPPVIPQHVMDLQMATVNTGVPHSFFTCADSKGVQYVTT